MNKFDLQRFAAETNTIKQADLEPAISIDHTSRIAENINTLKEILGITDMQPMAAGTLIKIYKITKENTPTQVGEGEKIPLTKITRKLAKTIEVKLKKYRKETTAEAISSIGYDKAVNATDEKLISEIQKEIKADFFDLIATGTGSAKGTNLQTACANAWSQLQIIYEDKDVNAVYFVSPVDVAEYLGKSNITMQTAFGLSYIQDFLGLGTLIVNPRLAAGTVIATAKENLCGAYIPASSSDVAVAFGLTADATGLVGMKHYVTDDTATHGTLAFSGVKFYPETLDGIVVTDIEEPVVEEPEQQPAGE